MRAEAERMCSGQAAWMELNQMVSGCCKNL